MGILYGAYRVLSSGIFYSCAAPFCVYLRIRGRHGKGMRERLGLIHPPILRMASGSPRIWLHAASLGEVKVAAGLKQHIEKLMPGSSIIVSTSTEHGYNLALNAFRGYPVIHAPLDAPFAVKKALSSLHPDVMVFLETEIWPVWITEARKMGIRVALVNGRISNRSIHKYLALQPFFRDVLKNMDVFSMIRDEDAERIRSMGADPARVRVNGNAKYETLAQEADPSLLSETRRILRIGPSQVVLVAGSTRPGEEEMILDVYERILRHFPEAMLILVPRHIARTPAIESLLRARSVRYQLRTELGGGRPRVEPVVVGNTFGELFGIYSVGTINFCGGSLVPLGGQNPLEPAAWGKAAFFGPFMENFLDARSLLEAESAGIEVLNTEDFAEKAIRLLKDPAALRSKGERAKQALLRNMGAAERHARVIARLAGLPESRS